MRCKDQGVVTTYHKHDAGSVEGPPKGKQLRWLLSRALRTGLATLAFDP